MVAALTIDALEVDFSGFKAVDGMTTVINEGELRVVLGPNGAGKTTLMDLISGKTASTGGEVRLFGRDITNRPEHQIARAGVGRKFQIPSVFRDLTVHDNLRVAVSHEPRVFRNLRLGMAPADRARIDEVIALTGLEPVLDVIAGDLSHGQMQWLELGMLITQQARVILLDEPTAGMTQAETLKTADIILKLKGNHTLLVVEHDMAFVRKIAERVTVMHLGRLLAEGPMAKIEQDPAVRDAYLGSGGAH
ncbi:urea ABC transporter ATP-binding protein UrtD [Salipiger aestuarii]|uniref:Urea transport system ATP-binding protein n=1 Tax=Salipiger aestuarii TaxID=568098 RepID=A0A327XUG3_9RHOB|nr:urea ABC transporter ATP-binding protein UrtD [Salipiger aestuarii]KAA8607868.1 urea ABC transporter ATP-binding protein [Salipiger aestuarii]KAB2538683.1 urea ABC transporter ATP-binding protein [Salipiger aestuarii]RAK12344.1 urea transport system ATP-binding protein [Salipiger aestuarii]